MTFWLLCLAFSFVLTVADSWRSGANVTEQDLCPWCCDWTGVGSLASSLPCPFLSVRPFTPSICGEQQREGGQWVTRLLISIPKRKPICLRFPHFFPPEEPGRQGERTHLQTRPADLASPLIPLHPSQSTALPRSLQLLSLSVPVCWRQRQGQPARPAGVLVCGIVLISTGVWRRRQRYLPPPPPSFKPPMFLLFRSPSLHLLRLLPSRCLRRQICEGCRCQLSFHGRLPTPLHIFRLLSFPRLFPALVFSSTFSCSSVNKLCLKPVSVFQPCLRAGAFFNARHFCLWHTYGTLAQL